MKNESARIVLIQGPQTLNEIPLEKRSYYLGRVDETTEWEPDIDLSPDFWVSRKHARLFFENDGWWLEDLGSKRGTLIEGKEIKGFTSPTELGQSMTVQMGNTLWMVAPQTYIQKKVGDLIVGLKMVKVINYAVYHCGIPIISSIVIRNQGSIVSPPISLTVYIKGYSQPWHKRLDPLPPGKKRFMDKVYLNLDYEKLEGNEGRKKAQLSIQLNDTVISLDEISILGFFEWPTDPVFRKTLACFVQPSHPLVQNIVLDAIGYLKNSGYSPSFTQLIRTDMPVKAGFAMKALYECLRDKYNIRYVLEAPSYEHESQVIRPAHRVISEIRKDRGRGTCIDLALLFASCLENIRLQPILIFIKEKGPYQHLFLGCWNEAGEHFRPVITEFKHIDKEQVTVLETTGVTDRWGEKLTYEEAVEKARAQFEEEYFLFALDIAATRQTVVPLQFPMSPGTTHILREAETLARKQRSPKLETKHLFLSLLFDEDRDITKILDQSGGGLAKTGLEEIANSILTTSHPGKGRFGLRPTINHRRVLEDARIVASDIGLGFTEKTHLFYALLLSQSGSVDTILEKIGSNRKKVKNMFEAHFDWTGEVEETYFEKSL